MSPARPLKTMSTTQSTKCFPSLTQADLRAFPQHELRRFAKEAFLSFPDNQRREVCSKINTKRIPIRYLSISPKPCIKENFDTSSPI